jgi:hypothetical protein
LFTLAAKVQLQQTVKRLGVLNPASTAPPEPFAHTNFQLLRYAPFRKIGLNISNNHIDIINSHTLALVRRIPKPQSPLYNTKPILSLPGKNISP